MKKIMFSEKFGLTKAVLSGRKTQTRRIITCPKEFKGEWVAGFYVYKRESDGAIINWPCMYDADEATFDGGEILPKYKLGEVVAVAQSYKDAGFHPDTQMEQEIRGSKTKGVPTYEYMHFRYSYSKIEECIEKLNKLGADGWEIATCAGEDSFAAYLILKRETLHTSKTNNEKI